jgi:hypothetical protein
MALMVPLKNRKQKDFQQALRYILADVLTHLVKLTSFMLSFKNL